MDDVNVRAGHKAYNLLGSRFEIPDTYEVIELVGSGAYGVVIAAKDKLDTAEG